MSLDAYRERYPRFGMSLFAMEPGGPVTLEVYTPDDQVFQWHGATAAEAFAKAFPPLELVEEVTAPEPVPLPNAFD